MLLHCIFSKAGAVKGGQSQLNLLDLLLINAAGDTDDLMGALYPSTRTALPSNGSDADKVAALALGRRSYGCSAVVRHTDARGSIPASQ